MLGSSRRRGPRWAPLAVLIALATSSAHATPKRWPTWPSEVSRIAAVLVRDVRGKEIEGERQRVAAIQKLDRYATGAILEPLLHALDDASPQVRREALRMCFEREVVACIPGAANLWSEGGEPTVRVAALKVLALDPEPSRAALLIDALRDPSEVIRAQAADFLGSAPLSPDVRKRVRTALLAKLADVAVVVRRRAVLSLGMLGPGEGALSIARLLDDPEPTVRAAAAEALGHYRDPTTAPALRRAIASANEAAVARAIIDALAVLPDPSVEEDLLALLDDPPPGLDEKQLASAITRRPSPGTTLLEGLVDRLDEPVRRDAALQILLAMGHDAQPVLVAARERGLAPAIDVEVERLLRALEPTPAAPPDHRWPQPTDRAGWHEQLERTDAFTRRRAAARLARHDPKWRVPAALAALARPGPIAGRQAWASTLALSPEPWSVEDDAEPRARLERWARDTTISPVDRCLAVLALGAREPDSGRRATVPWADLIGDAEPRVRACTALALGRQGLTDVLPGALVDDRARVRTAAALALGLRRDALDRNTSARLSLLALEDPEAPVRAAARWALSRSGEPGSLAPGSFSRRVAPHPWRDPPRWIEVEHDGHQLWLPAEGTGRWRWALVPGLAQATPHGDTEPLIDL